MKETPTPPESPPPLGDVPREILRSAIELYLDVHAHPELSGAERRTADRFAAHLEASGCTVTRKVGGGHGLVGVLRNGAGPVVMLRTELDALPVTERTGLAYASTVPGVMHACGHDLHLAAVAGAVAELARTRSAWRGTVLVVGQPAEETLTGARQMLADGLYERFGTPDVVLAQHTSPAPAGTLAHAADFRTPLMAAGAAVDVTLYGRGGHAGTPHLAVDPVLAAAATVLRLQSVVSRETAPAEHAVLSVGTLRAGERGNVIPDTAELTLCMRALSDPVLDRMTAAALRIVRAECAASGCPRDPDFTVTARSPALLTDAAATASVRGAHEALFGPERVTDCGPLTATEDFSWFGSRGVATVYWMLGVSGVRQWRAARDGGTHVPPNHSPEFAPDVRTALPAGITAMASAAGQVLTREGDTT
ncbi:amidohydrolase [Streptomyces sp. NBC_01217]|uniref:amidohydrolase n=1 Tax=Streptomyces sp. NBC_01217 TaxID=2903779 RepID=UPI002E0FF267|nr:amidohydrolase [Streptomyces sp. NBC_01217]